MYAVHSSDSVLIASELEPLSCTAYPADDQVVDLLTITELLGLVRLLGDVVKTIDEANTMLEHLVDKRIRIPRVEVATDNLS